MLIGVTGYAQHGKDTVANLLVTEYGFTRIAFADALKSMALVLDPLIGDHDWRLSELVKDEGWESAKTVPEVRRFLQVLGTEAVRDHLGNGSWVQALHKQREGIENLVIPDVRFPNEAAYVKEHGFLLKVERINEDDTPYDNGIGVTHPSEAHIVSMPADATLVASDVEALEEAVRGGIERLLQKENA